ncbi:putative pectate lyase F [Fusarium oxysporum f. sp. albedinis]|nr:putative pectate lyase F [Fusarium oxysporum f. sp. albedinis]
MQPLKLDANTASNSRQATSIWCRSFSSSQRPRTPQRPFNDTTLAATKIRHREDPTTFLRGKGKTEYAVVWLRPVPEVGRQLRNYNSAARARSPRTKRSDRGSALISVLKRRSTSRS